MTRMYIVLWFDRNITELIVRLSKLISQKMRE